MDNKLLYVLILSVCSYRVPLQDNKLFRKTIKFSFSDEIVTRDRIHLTENGEDVKTELETAETLNYFLGNNVMKNLMILKYSEYNPSIDRVEN